MSGLCCFNLACHLPGNVWFSSPCAKASHASPKPLVQRSCAPLLVSCHPLLTCTSHDRIKRASCSAQWCPALLFPSPRGPTSASVSVCGPAGWLICVCPWWEIKGSGKRKERRGRKGTREDEHGQSPWYPYKKMSWWDPSPCTDYTAIKWLWNEFCFKFGLQLSF